MKLKEGFILRKVGKQYVVAVTGEASRSFNGMMRLDESAAFAFEQLRSGCTREELIRALVARYNADEAQTAADVERFLATLKEADALV